MLVLLPSLLSELLLWALSLRRGVRKPFASTTTVGVVVEALLSTTPSGAPIVELKPNGSWGDGRVGRGLVTCAGNVVVVVGITFILLGEKNIDDGGGSVEIVDGWV